MDKDIETHLQPDPYVLVPNPERMTESLFQNWVTKPASQTFIMQELKELDSHLDAQYQRVIRDRNDLEAKLVDLTLAVENHPDSLLQPDLARNAEEIDPAVDEPSFEASITKETLTPLDIEIKKNNVPNTLEQKLEGLPPKLEVKKDSGIDLDSDVDRHPVIPQFYFPFGEKGKTKLIQIDELKETLARIFNWSPSSPGKLLEERDFVEVTVACGLSRYLNTTLFRKVSIGAAGVTYDTFLKYWTPMLEQYHTLVSLTFAVLKNPQKNHITSADIYTVVQDVTLYHPGLQFLSELPVFQNRYTETVVTRLFYSKLHNHYPHMTLSEFKKTEFFDSLMRLDTVKDINLTQDLFSYQHFYVIYCKFWELDSDHDMIINLSRLVKYDVGTMTEAILKRVINGCGKPMEQPGSMNYEDFIWFILSTEDKRTTQAIEYWFRCVDLDGDGIISLYEIEHFYTHQYRRMQCSRMSDTWKFEDYVCSLMDLIRPKVAHQVTLRDLKNSRSAGLFFDMLFDLRKYDSYMRRIDPIFRDIDEMHIDNPDGTKTILEGFQKFAARSYMILADEESQGDDSSDQLDDYAFNDPLDQGMPSDWSEDTEEHSWGDEDDDEVENEDENLDDTTN